MSARNKKKQVLLCGVCGQYHEIGTNHLYDYYEHVDEELTCQVCLQPLVNPMDTVCGHTYCAKCLKSVLRLKKMCPIDRNPLTSKDTKPASIMVQKLLDKLKVLCPNASYCTDVMTRCDLEAHLKHRCPGTQAYCVNAPIGCSFTGPRMLLDSHIWDCPLRDKKAVAPAPIMDGVITTIELDRTEDELGFSIVGGNDTPLVGIVVQEVFPGGLIDTDGRVLQGDQILEVNGEDLRDVTHSQGRAALSRMSSVVRLTILREKVEDKSLPSEREEVTKVSLARVYGVPLGIKIVGKKNEPGVYILDLIEDSVAFRDGRLCPDDRILEINHQDMRDGTPEAAAHAIKSSKEKVNFVVSRMVRPTTPDLIKCMAQEFSTFGMSNQKAGVPQLRSREKFITINKESSESLGISVSGGLNSGVGDIPLYVSDIQPNGAVGRDGQLQHGDVLISINSTSLVKLTHAEAVGVLKACAGFQTISMKCIAAQGHELMDANRSFTPSWVTWLTMPRYCHVPLDITLEKGSNCSLGFSIVGGADYCHGYPAIFVKSVVPYGPAEQDGRLRCGDQILAVNGQALQDMTHAVTVALLKRTKGRVTLTVVHWPGSMH